ncbi:MAG: DMT family transporter [bacterium]|nr:DMT family transporter [bacterium]
MSISIGIILGLAAMFGWGISDLFAKKAVSKTGAFVLAFWAQLISLVMMASLLFFVDIPKFSVDQILTLIIAGIFCATGILSFYKGLSLGKLSLVAPVAASYPVLVVLFSIIFLKEMLTNFQIAGIVLIIIGTIAVSLESKKIKIGKELMFAFGALISWGIMFFLIGMTSKQLGWLFPILFVKCVTILLFSTIALSKAKPIFSPVKNVVLLVVLVAIFEFIAFLSVGAGFAFDLVSIVTTISAAFPAVAVLLALFVLKEKILLHQKIAILVVLAGLVLVSL